MRPFEKDRRPHMCHGCSRTVTKYKCITEGTPGWGNEFFYCFECWADVLFGVNHPNMDFA